MAALDIDRRQIHAVGGIDQEVPQAIDNVGVQQVGQVSRQMPKQAICARGVESLRRLRRTIPPASAPT